MTRRLLLVRHPPVDPRFTSLCYGSSDVPLGSLGRAQAADLARRLATEPITILVHSGLSRAAIVADQITSLTGWPAVVDARLRERDFGEWELRPWDEIYAGSGSAMMGMVTDPDEWRPPGGETTHELRDRVLAWYQALPAVGTIVVLTHGGPIAALRGALARLPARDWPKLIPNPGTVVELDEEVG